MQLGKACETGLKLLKQRSTTHGTSMSEMDGEKDNFAGLDSTDSDNDFICSVPVD